MPRTLRLVAYDPEWPAQYDALATRIRGAVGPQLLDIQHVGSTAVPGLLSKPVIDIAATVANESDADACIAPLEALGFRYRGTNGDDPRRRYYVLAAATVRDAQLHLYILPASAWRAVLTFRDALRADPSLVASYAAEKQRLAELVDWDKTAYSVAKGPFVQDVLATRR
jgi:GrpB-like predicted nucleotidyltransferase (UPF0157 family)